jgi:hypothetical protein
VLVQGRFGTGPRAADGEDRQTVSCCSRESWAKALLGRSDPGHLRLLARSANEVHARRQGPFGPRTHKMEKTNLGA